MADLLMCQGDTLHARAGPVALVVVVRTAVIDLSDLARRGQGRARVLFAWSPFARPAQQQKIVTVSQTVDSTWPAYR